MKKIAIAVMCCAALALGAFACGSSGSSGGSTPAATLLGPDGSTATSLDAASPVAASLSGLTANTQYTVKVADPSGSVVCESAIYTDNSGTIPSSQYCYIRDTDTSRNATESRVDAMIVDGVPDEVSDFFSLGKSVTSGDYTLTVYDSSGAEVLTKSGDGREVPLTKAFPVTTTAARTCASSAAGLCARSFLQTTSNVYVTIEEGSGVAEGASVDIYIVADRCNQGYASGVSLQDVSGGMETVTVNYNASGLFTTATPVWATPATTGIFDVIVDVDKSGTYSTGDLVEIVDQAPTDTASTNGLCAAGFTVQSTCNATTGYITQIAVNRTRANSDSFSKARNEDIYAQLNPECRVAYHAWVYKYVVAHRDTWSGGEALTDVIDVTKDQVQFGCTNQGLRLVAPINLIATGCYDIVFDANGNGVYDIGLDAVDNIDNSGAATCGFVVVDDAQTVTISSITDSLSAEVKDGTSSSTSSKMTVTGTASGFSDSATVRAYAVRGTQMGGEVVGSISSGTFTISQVPVISGLSTVKVLISEGTTYGGAEANVTWNPGGTTGVDIMAVVTWTGSTDMDTHFIKPDGTYTGRTAGTNYTDCTWDNCAQDNNEAINWTTAAGTAVLATDSSTGAIARMDLDCINTGGGCPSRTETVWIQDASLVPTGSTGDKFLLCVVAFSGNDRPSIQVSIKGVAQTSITAPSNIDSSTGNDMWFAGYVSRSGSNLTWNAVNQVGVGAAVCTQ